jgi:hypothetical protein
VRILAEMLSFLCVLLAGFCGMNNMPLTCAEWTGSAILFAIGAACFGRAQGGKEK